MRVQVAESRHTDSGKSRTERLELPPSNPAAGRWVSQDTFARHLDQLCHVCSVVVRACLVARAPGEPDRGTSCAPAEATLSALANSVGGRKCLQPIRRTHHHRADAGEGFRGLTRGMHHNVGVNHRRTNQGDAKCGHASSVSSASTPSRYATDLRGVCDLPRGYKNKNARPFST
jgi:hypothetical protein